MSLLSALRDELTCSICLCTYTEPVTLKCGHNFCRPCIEQVLDTQGPARISYFPYCRKCFKTRPCPQPNTTLYNLVKRLQVSAASSTGNLSCPYCINVPVFAGISCLLSEASLCNDHIAAHNKSPEHVLVPATFHQDRKYIFHRKVLNYFNPEDETCVYCAAHKSEQQTGPSERLNLSFLSINIAWSKEKEVIK